MPDLLIFESFFELYFSLYFAIEKFLFDFLFEYFGSDLPIDFSWVVILWVFVSFLVDHVVDGGDLFAEVEEGEGVGAVEGGVLVVKVVFMLLLAVVFRVLAVVLFAVCVDVLVGV